MTLRTRLFLSHGAVIIVTLLVMAIALFVLLAQLQALRNATNLAPDLVRVTRSMRQDMPVSSAQIAFDHATSLVQLPRRIFCWIARAIFWEIRRKARKPRLPTIALT